MLGALGGAAFGALLSAVLIAYDALTGSVLVSAPFLAVTGLGALAGLAVAGGFLLARPAHGHRAWLWWALGLLPLGLFYGALLGVIVTARGGLAERFGTVAVVAILALALVSAALMMGHSVALMHGGGAISRGVFTVAAGVVYGCATGLGFGIASLVTLRPVCQPHQYCLEPDPSRILQVGLLIGAILGLLLGIAGAFALAASAAQRAEADFHASRPNVVAGA